MKKISIIKNIKEYINNKELIFNIIIFLIYVIVTSYIGIHHENWSDEAQSWLISRDLSIIDIFKEMKYEQHSMLWNLILIPFIKLGFPYEYFSMISCFIVDISVYIILFKIKTRKIIKLFIIFSEPYIYFYSSIARCYCLIPLFISILIMLEQNKEKNIYLHAIILAFLVNTHAIMIPIVVIIALVKYVNNIREYKIKNDNKNIRKSVISLCIVGLGIIMFLIQIINIKSSIVLDHIKHVQDVKVMMYRVLSTLKNICFYILPDVVSVILFLILGILTIVVSKYYKRQAIIFWISFFCISIVNCKIFLHSNIQRSQIIIILLFYIAVDIYRNKKENVPKYIKRIAISIYIVICTSSIIDTLPIIKCEIKENYSSAKETMEYINSNYGDGYTICCFSNYFNSTALIPYANKEYKFYDLVNEREWTYYHWDKTAKEYRDTKMENVELALINRIKNNKKVVLVVSEEMNYLVNFIEADMKLELKYVSRKIFEAKINVNEEYYVYDINDI